MERWKPIVGYEGYYEVSDMGRVRSVTHKMKSGIKHNNYVTSNGRILKQSKKRNGYFSVDLCKEGHIKTISVHRIVATAFCPKRVDDIEVNHINCDKSDNRACNLEWCTSSQNIKHAADNNLFYNPNKKPVRCKQTQTTFESSYKAAEWLNETKFQSSRQVKNIASKIRSTCLGYQKFAYGYTWEYC